MRPPDDGLCEIVKSIQSSSPAKAKAGDPVFLDRSD